MKKGSILEILQDSRSKVEVVDRESLLVLYRFSVEHDRSVGGRPFSTQRCGIDAVL